MGAAREASIRTGRVAGVAATVGLLMITLVGCSDPDPTFESPAAPSATPSSRTPTPPALSPAATRHDRAGAEAFTSYWFAVLSHSIRTGDTTLLQQAGDPQCQVCATALELIRNSYDDGGSLSGGVYTVREARALEDLTGSVVTVPVIYDRSPRTGTGPLGDARGRLDGQTFAECDVRLRWTGSAWKMRGIDAAQPVV